MRRVLVVTPTYLPKNYSLGSWFDGITGLDIPSDVEVDVLVLVNNEDLFDHAMLDRVHEEYRTRFPEKDARDWFFTANIPFRPDVPLDYRIASLYNIARAFIWEKKYDYLFIVEADVELAPDNLRLLLDADKDVVSGVTSYADWDAPGADSSGVMVFREMPTEPQTSVPFVQHLNIYSGAADPREVELHHHFLSIIPSFPFHRPYTIAEAREKHGVLPERSFSFGCLLIRRRVLTGIRFRCGVLSTVFPDFLFCSDLVRAGIQPFVHWDVRPKHHPHEWFTKGVTIGQRVDPVSSGRLW